MPERTSRVSDVAVARDETPQTQVTKPPPLGFGQVVATFNGLVNNLAGQLFAAPQRFTGPSPSANIVPLADRVVGQSPQRHFYSRYAKSLAVAFAAGAIPKARKWIAGLTASMIAAKALFGAKQ